MTFFDESEIWRLINTPKIKYLLLCIRVKPVCIMYIVYDGLQRKESHALHHSYIFETINVIYVQIVFEFSLLCSTHFSVWLLQI